MVETKHNGPCCTVIIKMKNEKPLILFLSTLNVISGNSEIFLLLSVGLPRKISELPSADQRKMRDHSIRIFLRCDTVEFGR